MHLPELELAPPGPASVFITTAGFKAMEADLVMGVVHSSYRLHLQTLTG